MVLAAYLLTASGHIQTIDAQQELKVATRVVSGHGFTIRSVPFAGGGTRRGQDGRQYAAHDLGMSFVYAPLTLLPGTVGRGGEPTQLMVLASGLLDAVIGAMTVFVMADLLVRLGIGRRAAGLTTLLFAFTTMQWVYAHIAFDAASTALAVLGAVWCLVRDRAAPSARWLLAGGAALGAAVAIRSDSLVLVPFLSIPVLARVWIARHRLRDVVLPCAAWALPVLTAVALNGWYNWFRFGSILDNGHLKDPLLRNTTPLVEGLAGQLISPGKGTLFFSPLVLVALAGWLTFARRERLLAATFGATIVANLLAHARFVDWSGASAWGSRHTMPVLALLLLPIAYLLDRFLPTRAVAAEEPGRPRRLARRSVVAIALVGLAVQITGVAVDYQQVGRASAGASTGTSTSRFQEANWKPSASQIWLGAKAIGRSVTGGDPYPGPSPQPPDRFDLWWVRELTAGRYVVAAVVAPPLLLAAAVVTALGLMRALRDEEGDVDHDDGERDAGGRDDDIRGPDDPDESDDFGGGPESRRATVD